MTKFLVAALAAAAIFAAEAPRIVYSKSFPGSRPAFVEVRVEQSGECEYREAPDEDLPLKFRLSEPESAGIFALAEKLDRFKRPLEANLKVANMGLKTFRFEQGAERSEVKFNFSLDPDARAIQERFERIVETEQHFINLERTVRFDKLGVYQAILGLEASRDRGRLVAAEQFLPLLDRVSKNETYVHMARERATALAESIRAPKAKPE